MQNEICGINKGTRQKNLYGNARKDLFEVMEPINQLTPAQLERIMNWVFVLGNPDANITILQYLDLQCIFCKILHETNVVNQALQNHPDTVNHISKNLPIPGHERGLQWSEAMLFTGTIAWSEKYYELRDKLFWTPLNIASIKKSIDSIWMDSQTATRVLESKRFVNRVKDETNECYQIFSQHSVPATVILNNKTGKYIKLESHWWKIPLESIEKSIKKLW